MFTEPLSGWREVTVRETKTKVDWAVEMARLLEGRYADVREGDPGLRQPEHAHEGRVLRSVSNRHGRASWSAASSSATRPSTAVG